MAGALAWVVGAVAAGVVALAYFAKNSYDQVIAAKETRIADLKGRISTTLVDYEKRQRAALEETVTALEKARDKSEANQRAWQARYDRMAELVATLHEKLKELDPSVPPLESGAEPVPESDLTVINLAIDGLENLRDERDYWLREHEDVVADGLQSMAEDGAADSLRDER